MNEVDKLNRDGKIGGVILSIMLICFIIFIIIK